MSERLFQVDLLDAQARSSRVSMLLPESLVLAETELRCSADDALLGGSLLKMAEANERAKIRPNDRRHERAS